MIEKVRNGYRVAGIIFPTKREAQAFEREEETAASFGVKSKTRREHERAVADLKTPHGHMGGLGFPRLGG